MSRQRKLGLLALVVFLALVTMHEADIIHQAHDDAADPRIDALLNTSAGRMSFLEQTIEQTLADISQLEDELSSYKKAENSQVRSPAGATFERVVYGSYGPESYFLPEQFLDKANELNELHSFARESQASLENFSWFVGRLSQLRPDSDHAVHEHSHDH